MAVNIVIKEFYYLVLKGWTKLRRSISRSKCFQFYIMSNDWIRKKTKFKTYTLQSLIYLKAILFYQLLRTYDSGVKWLQHWSTNMWSAY